MKTVDKSIHISIKGFFTNEEHLAYALSDLQEIIERWQRFHQNKHKDNVVEYKITTADFIEFEMF